MPLPTIAPRFARFRALAAMTASLLAATVATGPAAAAPEDSYTLFESGLVRPLAMSPDGTRLFACNTPDNRLEIFDVTGAGLSLRASVPVGLEPVAVAALSNTEVWVVNHLSDSVSIVDVSDPDTAVVTRTLLVGDEPRDIVFAGTGTVRAYITTAHRGQNIDFDPEFTTPGVGRADVWVFDPADLGSSFGGDEETVITLFADTPRALTVSPDGSTVYAAAFHSGNQTTVLSEGAVPDGGEGSGGLPAPDTDVHGDPRPEVGLIIKYDGAAWRDELGRDWTSRVRFNLPDYDVFAIDADANPPEQIAGTPGRFPHVGTILFNMVTNPVSGKIYVSNTEAINEVRFEGPGVFAGQTVRSHLHESRITVIDPDTESVTPRHLNKHIDYDTCCATIPNATNAASLAFPVDMQVSSDGNTLYVAAFGSSKIGIFDTNQLETDTFVPSPSNHVQLSGGGPAGVVLDETNGRLYVLTRFDNSISVVNTAMGTETDHIAMHNPEPDYVVEGRRFLYDAAYTSSNGDQACASCHVFGDFDSLAWDLGNPDDETLNNPSPLTIPALGISKDFHPMKGPMTTQSLRGMDNHGPMHWRGDRTGGNSAANAQPDSGIYNEQAAFKAFNPAFTGLIGRAEQLTTAEMQAFTDFVLDIMYPPNPVRALDNSLTADQATSLDIYFNRTTDTIHTCNGCHVLDRDGNEAYGVRHPGFFGSDGRSSFENETQIMKIAHMRNAYQKVGMFGNMSVPLVLPGDNGHKGDQIRGFGFLHDGSMDTVFRFFRATVFANSGINDGFFNDTERRAMESLVLAFDTNLFPIVGQQTTLDENSGSDAEDRLDLLLARADAGDCDVVARGVVGGEQRGALYSGGGSFETDRSSEGAVADATLRDVATTAGNHMTFTAVPPGNGRRIGVDRDDDGAADTDEVESGGDPMDATVLPCLTTEVVEFDKAELDESKGRAKLKATLDGFYGRDTLGVSAADLGGVIFNTGVLGDALEAKGAGFKYKAAKGTQGIAKGKIKNDFAKGLVKLSLKIDGAWVAPGADESAATTTVRIKFGTACFEGQATRIKQ